MHDAKPSFSSMFLVYEGTFYPNDTGFRLTRESCQRKVSQTSADQLIEEHQFSERCPNEGGLGDGSKKDPGAGGPRATLLNSGVVFNTIDNRPTRSNEGKGGDEGQSDTFPRNSGFYGSKQKQKSEREEPMSTFRPQNSPLPAANPHPNSTLLSPQPPPSISSTASKQHSEQHNSHRISSCTESTSGGSVGQRSSGDGGSGSDMDVGSEHQHHPHDPLHHPHHLQLPLTQHTQASPPYAKVKVMTARGLVEVEEEDEEEESHYSLIRRPDGQADELVNR